MGLGHHSQKTSKNEHSHQDLLSLKELLRNYLNALERGDEIELQKLHHSFAKQRSSLDIGLHIFQVLKSSHLSVKLKCDVFALSLRHIIEASKKDSQRIPKSFVNMAIGYLPDQEFTLWSLRTLDYLPIYELESNKEVLLSLLKKVRPRPLSFTRQSREKRKLVQELQKKLESLNQKSLRI